MDKYPASKSLSLFAGVLKCWHRVLFYAKRRAALGACVSLFLGASLVLLFPARDQNKPNEAAWLLSSVLFLISCGFLTAQLRTQAIQNTVIAKKIGPVEIIGTLKSIERVGQEEGSRILLSDLKIERLDVAQTPTLVRLRLRKDQEIRSGDRIKILALLNPPSPPVAPGAFDFQRYLYFQKIGAVGFVYNQPEIVEQLKGDSASSIMSIRLDNLRAKITARVSARLEYPASSVAVALITGQRKMMKQGDLEALRGAGLAHMLAISGLHLGLVAGVFFFFSRLIMVSFMGFTLRYPVKKIAAAIAFIGALSYMALVGAPVTTQRAMIMTGIVLIAVMMDRTAISLRLVALAAFIVLVLAPEVLLSASFHMSFAAVTALIAVYQSLKPTLSRFYRSTGLLRKVALYFMGVCLTSLIASTATAPFALYHFQRFALFGLAGNFAAVPLMAFLVMPMAVFALLLMPLGLDFIPLYFMEVGINGILDIAHWVFALEGSVTHIEIWPLAALLCFVVAGLCLVLIIGRGKIMALPLALAGILFIGSFEPPNILIAASGKLSSFRTQGHALYASTRSNDRFTLENWERFAGLEEGEALRWPTEGSALENDALLCGEGGCHLLIDHTKIAFSKHPYGLQEDCQWADILIANYPVKDWECASPHVIDKFDTWRSGAHGVWIAKGGTINIKHANQSRGNRPWVLKKTSSRLKLIKPSKPIKLSNKPLKLSDSFVSNSPNGLGF